MILVPAAFRAVFELGQAEMTAFRRIFLKMKIPLFTMLNFMAVKIKALQMHKHLS